MDPFASFNNFAPAFTGRGARLEGRGRVVTFERDQPPQPSGLERKPVIRALQGAKPLSQALGGQGRFGLP